MVIADSWFGSVRACIALLERGLLCVLNVKTAHKYYPKDALNALAGYQPKGKADVPIELRGKHAVVSTTVQTIPPHVMYACLWLVKKPMYLVATAEHSQLSEVKKRFRHVIRADGSSARVEVETKCTSVHYVYKHYAAAVDVLNHIRQGGLSYGLFPLEDACCRCPGSSPRNTRRASRTCPMGPRA